MAILLLATAVMCTLPRWRSALAGASSQRLPLAQLLPEEIPGVLIENLPLGPNEFVDQKARDILDYDDVVFRAYHTPAGTFSVYIGHWEAGRFSPSFIAAHTPDRCWTMAGMTCLGFKTDYALAGADALLPGGEWRRFSTPNGQVLDVVFWHLVGGRLYDYGGRFHSFTEPFRRVQDVVSDLFVLHGSQHFIRVSSDRPFEELKIEPAFREVLGALKSLGSANRAETGSDP